MKLLSAVLLAVLLLCMTCARIQAPPGAGPDQEAPLVTQVQPEAGEQSLGLEPHIKLRFSEYMNRASVIQELRLNPDPGIRLKTSWKGRSLGIRMEEALPPGRTFTLELGGGARDLAGNHLAEPWRLLFATTGEPDTLQFQALLMDAEQAPFCQLWIWPADSFNTDLVGNAVWRSSPDSRGRVQVSGLPDTRLVAMVVDDANRNQLWDSPGEAGALPERPPVAGDTKPVLFRLCPELFQPKVDLRSAVFLDPWRVELRGLLEPVLLENLEYDARKTTQGDQLRLQTLALTTEDGNRLPLAAIKRQNSLESWLLFLEHAADSGLVTQLIAGGIDTLKLEPLLAGRLPDLFTEPPADWRDGALLLSSSQRLFQTDSLNVWQKLPTQDDSLSLPLTRLDACTFKIVPDPNAQRLILPQGLLRGMESVWPDSTISIRVPRPASRPGVGGLAWTMDRLPADDDWRLVLQSQDADQVLPLALEDQLDSLNSGPCTFALFKDRNANGRWDPGSLQGQSWSEPWLALPDTVEILEDWVQTGLDLQLPGWIK